MLTEDEGERQPRARRLQYAQVAVDLDVAHLDHPFDYIVPDELVGQVQVGSQAQVRFGRRLTPGFVVGLSAETSHAGRLAPISRVIAPVPVLSEGIIQVAQYLARRYAVSLSQVLSLIVPTRRASVEKEPDIGERSPEAQKWEERQEPSSEAQAPRRQVTTALPGGALPLVVAAAQAQKRLGRTSTILFPTANQCLVAAEHVSASTGLRVGLSHSEMSAAARYRSYLKMMLGDFDVMIGTRSAIWLPMPKLGGLIIWDDGSDLYRERRTPRFDVLDVGVARSHVEGLDLLVAGYARSVKSQYLVNEGWAHSTTPSKDAVWETIPKIRFFGEEEAKDEGAAGSTRLPNAAYQVIREGLAAGPVLVQVTAKGHTTLVGDEDEGESTRVRVGADRIGEELAQAFPKASVTVSSSTSGVKPTLDAEHQIVVATGGAEPLVPTGYAAVVITGASGTAFRPGMDSKVDALRRWMGALALGAPRCAALLVGQIPEDLRAALSKWDPTLVASEVLAERELLGFPPTRWVVAVTGTAESVDEVLSVVQQAFGEATVSLPGEARGPLTLVGKVDVEENVRLVLSVANSDSPKLMTCLTKLRKEYSKARRPLFSVHVNPSDLVGDVS